MQREHAPTLYIVIPCYNEEKVLPLTAPLFAAKLSELMRAGKAAKDSRVLFVDDGSKDGTWALVEELSNREPLLRGISLSRNRGHQNALLAGLMEAKDKCDVTISIDCDGQDDVNAMDDMLSAYMDGCEIVYGVRENRATDTAFKRGTAQAFYRFLGRMGAEVVYNHADYRLMSARVLQEFANFKEVNLFLRGMVPLVGFKSTSVYYKRQERMAGASHYPLRKMLALALDGVTSMSTKPIRCVTMLGFIISLLSFLCIIWVLIVALTGGTVTGWASTVCIVSFIGGIQMLSLGVIGEYVGKIYMEAKARPRYIIEKRTGNDDDDSSDAKSHDSASKRG